MPRENFDLVDTLLVDPDTHSRNVVRRMLRELGFQQVRYGKSLSDLAGIFRVKTPDFLILDQDLPDGTANTFVHEIRHHVHGRNPFIPIISLIANPEPEMVKSVLEAGTDHIIVKPIPRGQLVQRINLLINARRPFLVTTDYIGPDRRTADDRKNDIPLVHVPNSLYAKAVDRLSTKELLSEISVSFSEVNLRKLERHTDQIGYLCNQLVPKLRTPDTRPGTRPDLERLLYVAEDSRRRLGGTKYDHISELCGSLIEVTRALLATLQAPDQRNIELLQPLQIAIQSGVETGTAKAAREIVDQIGTRYAGGS